MGLDLSWGRCLQLVGPHSTELIRAPVKSYSLLSLCGRWTHKRTYLCTLLLPRFHWCYRRVGKLMAVFLCGGRGGLGLCWGGL